MNPADAVRTLALLVQALAAAVQEQQVRLQLELLPLVQQAQALEPELASMPQLELPELFAQQVLALQLEQALELQRQVLALAQQAWLQPEQEPQALVPLLLPLQASHQAVRTCASSFQRRQPLCDRG